MQMTREDVMRRASTSYPSRALQVAYQKRGHLARSVLGSWVPNFRAPGKELVWVLVPLAVFTLLVISPARAEQESTGRPPAGGEVPSTSQGMSVSPPAATTRRELPAARLSAPPTIDGDLSDPAWQQAAKADRFTDNLFGNPVADQAIVYVGYDDNYIYIGFYAYDSRPQSIVARQTKRGGSLAGDDTFTFSIDTFNTHKGTDHSSFSLNALGTQVASLASGRGTKLEWEGAWKSGARITADGWCGEMAIPWSILNYPSTNEAVTCAINFSRFQQRTQVVSWWSNIGVHEFYELDGQWVKLHYPGFRPRLSLLPYGISAWSQEHGATLRSGLDARYTLTPALTAVATIRPDFATVEEAVEGIDFSYGERFVPERRPFFQEGADIFSSEGAFGRYFYSRRIPQFDMGAKLYGKVTDRNTLGVLTTFDLGRQAVWFLRARHELGPTSNVNVALLGQDESGGVNQVLVAGEEFRKGLWNANASWAGTWKEGSGTGSAASATLFYQSPRWLVQIQPQFITPDFQDELGLIPFTGYKGISATLFYSTQWRTGPLRLLSASAFANSTARYQSVAERDAIYKGLTFQRQQGASMALVTRSDYTLILGWNGGRFLQFNDSVFIVSLRGRVTDPFRNYGIDVSWGRQGGAPSLFVTPSATWKWGSLTVGLSSAILSRQGVTQQHILTYGYDFGPRQGIVGRIVAQTGGTNGYLAYRQSGYGGVERFLILGDPNARTFTPGIALKVIWPH
jgi:hypothetical protein